MCGESRKVAPFRLSVKLQPLNGSFPNISTGIKILTGFGWKEVIMRLEGKKAVVTGASEGIGRSVAERLLQEGALVLLTGRDAEKLRATVKQMHQSLGLPENRALTFPADACDVVQAEAAVRKALKEFDQVDILVNCVGSLVRKSVAESTV